jgi:hypothetical protein
MGSVKPKTTLCRNVKTTLNLHSRMSSLLQVRLAHVALLFNCGIRVQIIFVFSTF